MSSLVSDQAENPIDRLAVVSGDHLTVWHVLRQVLAGDDRQPIGHQLARPQVVSDGIHDDHSVHPWNGAPGRSPVARQYRQVVIMALSDLDRAS
mgnify:CR=1 FL=1